MKVKTQFTVPEKEKQIPWRAALTEFFEEEDLEVALALRKEKKQNRNMMILIKGLKT